MKMEFVDEAELQKAADEPEDEVQRALVLGRQEADGGFSSRRSFGELEDVTHFSAAVAGAEYNVAVGLSRLDHEALYCTRLGDDPVGKRILKSMKGNHVSERTCDRDGHGFDRVYDERQDRGGRPEDRVFPAKQRGFADLDA